MPLDHYFSQVHLKNFYSPALKGEKIFGVRKRDGLIFPCQAFAMALPSFVEHLRILEGSGLVRSRKTGRVRVYRLAPGRLKPAEDWLARQRGFWESRLDRLDAYLAKLKEKRS